MRKRIRAGIYLIIDPSTDRNIMVGKLKEVVQEEIAAVQILDNFGTKDDQLDFINRILDLCHPKSIPVLINNQWQLMKLTNLDGIHFDIFPKNILQIKNELNRNFIAGITCNNDLTVLKWAIENQFDYISFCSMFPSSTANSCDLVGFDTVREATKITGLPVFLAGGIKPNNIEKLNELDYYGIAVASGILNADEPLQEIKKYRRKLKVI